MLTEVVRARVRPEEKNLLFILAGGRGDASAFLRELITSEARRRGLKTSVQEQTEVSNDKRS